MRKKQEVKRMDQSQSLTKLKQTFEFLLLAPREFSTDGFDEMNQDLSALLDVFLAIPFTSGSVSAPSRIDIHLQVSFNEA